MAEISSDIVLKLIEKINDLLSQRDTDDSKSKKIIQPSYLTDSNEYISRLTERKKTLDESNPKFQAGDIVEWQAGLKNRRSPRYRQPGIVVKVVNPAVTINISELNLGSYNESLDVLLGFITEEDEFICFLFDSKRFQIYKP